jgi:hypothetical protein
VNAATAAESLHEQLQALRVSHVTQACCKIFDIALAKPAASQRVELVKDWALHR